MITLDEIRKFEASCDASRVTPNKLCKDANIAASSWYRARANGKVSASLMAKMEDALARHVTTLKAPKDYVYFVLTTREPKMVKIGKTNMPKDRLIALAEWSPEPLEFFHMMDGGVDQERRIQCHLYDSWSHREWFRYDANAAELIEKLKSGELSVDQLCNDYTAIWSYHKRMMAAPMELQLYASRWKSARIHDYQKTVNIPMPWIQHRVVIQDHEAIEKVKGLLHD